MIFNTAVNRLPPGRLLWWRPRPCHNPRSLHNLSDALLDDIGLHRSATGLIPVDDFSSEQRMARKRR